MKMIISVFLTVSEMCDIHVGVGRTNPTDILIVRDARTQAVNCAFHGRIARIRTMQVNNEDNESQNRLFIYFFREYL